MRLRKQLLLVSLLMLSLPWAGCQYIREMESALREGQIAALEATAKAVAVALSNGPLLQETNADLSSNSAAAKTEINDSDASNILYAHPLPGALAVDGYVSDWWSIDYRMVGLIDKAGKHLANMMAGRHKEKLFLYLRIRDDDIVYFNPSKKQPYDHLSLHLIDAEGRNRSFKIFTSVPGRVEVTNVGIKNLGNLASRREYRVKGAWVESEYADGKSGYQLEMQVPLRWARGGLDIQIHGSEKNVENYVTDRYWQIQSRQAEVEEALEKFAKGDLRLRYLTQGGWILASAGELKFYQEQKDLKDIDFRTRVYSWVVGELENELDNPLLEGRYSNDEAFEALAGMSTRAWYQSSGNRVGRVIVPLFSTVPSVQDQIDTVEKTLDGTGDANTQALHAESGAAKITKSEPTIIGAVVAEQTSNNVVALTNSAFSRLLFYTFVIVFVAGFTLLVYASWLSYRIRQLSLSADAALSESGEININFPVSRSHDELGDLSRSFHQLLSQLNLHNSYLKTLASKLSHELRTPLAVVKSSLDNLEHHELSDASRTYTARAKEGADRLSSILNAMSAANRIEQSIQHAELETIDLKDFLEVVTQAYADAYAPQRIEFESHCSSAVIVKVAPDLLAQLLDKLVDNASDFSENDQAVVVSLDVTEAKVNISVTNVGPPLPENGTAQLFQSLVSYRDDASTAEGAQHMGLGLYIVRLIAEFHGGVVRAYNQIESKQVVFSLELPRTEAQR